MASKGSTAVYSIKELYAYVLIEDIENQLPIYSAGIKVPTIQTVSITESFETISLEGDGTITDVQSEISGVEVSMEYGRADHATQAIASGGLHKLLSDQSRYVLSGKSEAPFFAIAFRATKTTNTGRDYLVIVFKMKAGSRESETANKQFRTNTLEAVASQLNGDAKLHGQGNEFYIEIERDLSAATAIDPLSPFPAPGTVSAFTLDSSTPAADATGVAVDASVDLTFSAEVADEYLSTQYFSVVNKDTGQISNATFAKSGVGNVTVEVTPTADLEAATAHKVVVSKHVADSSGNALGAEEAFDFTTA